MDQQRQRTLFHSAMQEAKHDPYEYEGPQLSVSMELGIIACIVFSSDSLENAGVSAYRPV